MSRLRAPLSLAAMTAAPPDTDITILGSGPVAGALALLLARASPEPARLRLCQQAAPPQPADQSDTHRVMRTIALNHGSRTLLEPLGAWPAQGAAIHTIHVSQRGRLGRTVIRHEDFDVPELGTVHPWQQVLAAQEPPLAKSGITWQRGDKAVVVAEHDDHVVLAQGNLTWRSRVVIQADGRVEGPAANRRERPYPQAAVLATVTADLPQPGWAWERFTREGPLALLPVHTGGSPGSMPATYSLVWCCRPDTAAALCEANDAEFARQLNATFGHRLGWLAPAGPRQQQALTLRWQASVLQGRRLAIGNAAQTLHPVAGQGLNLGLRDAAQLAHALGPWLAQPDTSPDPLLRRFVERRRSDRRLTIAVTDLLPRIFATGFPPVEHACGLALLALDTLPGLRRPLARHLMLGLRS